MEDKTTVQVYASDLKKLNSRATRGQPLRDIIRMLLDNPASNIDHSGFETAKVPDNGRVRLTKAGGKEIEWRIKS